MNDQDLQQVASTIVEWFTRTGETIATAESLTAGLLSSTIADIPGASTCLVGGVATYATRTKTEILGVDPQLLKTNGPVDPQVATQMAENVRELYNTDWGIATTGVAGPAEQDGKPVGTVYIAIANESSSQVKALKLDGNRQQIRNQTVLAALQLLITQSADDI